MSIKRRPKKRKSSWYIVDMIEMNTYKFDDIRNFFVVITLRKIILLPCNAQRNPSLRNDLIENAANSFECVFDFDIVINV